MSARWEEDEDDKYVCMYCGGFEPTCGCGEER